jgi:hypothetical protein
MVDGDISELVTVSGDVVDLAVVDTYHITYDCVDTSGNDAEQAYRDVFVVDRSCPTCELKQPLVTVSGDVVDLAVVDTYHITYDCVDTSGNDAEQAYRDVFVIDRTCPTCELKQPLVTIEASFPYTAPKVFCSDTMPFKFHGKDYTVDAIVTGDKVDVEEVGTYFITYSATDSAGNTNTNYEYNAPGKGTTCNAGVSHVRTVIVEDSLVPIITLRESLMEETHDSVNAWIIGALASAVAGVALLGYATQKASATMVPV